MLPWFTESSADRFNDVRDTSLAKLVRDDMLALILKGVLAPGQRINEPDVASRLQVSRVPVREALRELESSGLVVSRKHSGVFVRQLDAAEIRDLYQMRGLLDGFAGRCAAGLATENARPAGAADGFWSTPCGGRRAARRAALLRRKPAFSLGHCGSCRQPAAVRDLLRHRAEAASVAPENLSQNVGVQASIAEHVEIVQALRDADAALRSLDGAPRERCLPAPG